MKMAENIFASSSADEEEAQVYVYLPGSCAPVQLQGEVTLADVQRVAREGGVKTFLLLSLSEDEKVERVIGEENFPLSPGRYLIQEINTPG